MFPTLYTVTRCGVQFKYTVSLHQMRQMLWSRMGTSYNVLTQRPRPCFVTVVSPVPFSPIPHNRTRRPAFYYP